jgi:hypothetical protein
MNIYNKSCSKGVFAEPLESVHAFAPGNEALE